MKEKKNKQKKWNNEFEFCKVCSLNHNQGRRHNFFPSHKSSLSSFLSRFVKRIADVRFFLKNPIILLPEFASQNRLWCVFCDCDIDELGSSIASGNAIRHLAGEDHLKNLKHFMWKYGGEMHRIDSFRITEAELAKWDKRCEALKLDAESSKGGSHEPSRGQSNNIQSSCVIINNIENNNIHFLDSNRSNDVMPLQCHTNENYQVFRSDMFLQDFKLGHPAQGSTLPFSLVAESDSNMCNSKDRTAYYDSQLPHIPVNGSCSTDSWNSYQRIHESERMNNQQPKLSGFQRLALINPSGLKEFEGNVHTGAPPPWLEAAGTDRMVKCHFKGAAIKKSLPPTKKSSKYGQLNTKRVGAAWAERRKIELELEKSGEIIANEWDAEWLPNFGGVWRSGSRKESRKEFEKEKQKLHRTESQSEDPLRVQPYISKRMRVEGKDDCEGHFTRSKDDI